MPIVIVVISLLDAVVALIFGILALSNILSTMRIPPLMAQNEMNLTIAKLLQAIAMLLFILVCSGLSAVAIPLMR
jgi:hypothetical protein